MMRRIGTILIAGIAGIAGIAASPAIGQVDSVLDSPHNLSTSGSGRIRATTEEQVCIFCHTPHRASAVRPLWNRAMPVVPYTVYTSSSLDAEPGQPTGASKKCLSCHDGSIALGSVVSRNQDIRMAGGITTLPPGSSNLGSDLSDDHPISFRFDSALAALDTAVINPHGLPPVVPLDANGELQCTTCHDAHSNTHGNFLVMNNADSALCATCHSISDTTIPAHRDCRSCHQAHSAPSGPFLLVEDTVTGTCLRCHDGTERRAGNVLADLTRVSTHDTNPRIHTDGSMEGTTCTDCHEPHTMMSGGTASAPNVAANLGRVRGVNGAIATTEYDVCFKCHGDANTAGTGQWIARQIVQTSTRLQFDPSAPSFHPVMSPGRNSDVPSLRPGWTEGSQVLCSHCHASDTRRRTARQGSGGVHGSDYPPLLAARYDTINFTPESSAAYALCYRCHERDGFNGILRDRTFPHSVHVVQSRTPCSACHDAHGISSAQGNILNNSHLINFDTRIVFPDPMTGLLQYVDGGMNSGSCTLSCHGVLHSPLSY